MPRARPCGQMPPQCTRRLEGSVGPAGRRGPGPGGGEGTSAGPAAAAPRAHGPLRIHLLPRLRPRDGGRPGVHARDRDPRPVLRRRAPLQLRRVRHAGAAGHLLHQRSRRDTPRAMGVGRQAAGGELRGGLPRQWSQRFRGQRRGRNLRPHLPRVHGRVQPDEDARALVPLAGG